MNHISYKSLSLPHADKPEVFEHFRALGREETIQDYPQNPIEDEIQWKCLKDLG